MNLGRFWSYLCARLQLWYMYYSVYQVFVLEIFIFGNFLHFPLNRLWWGPWKRMES